MRLSDESLLLLGVFLFRAGAFTISFDKSTVLPGDARGFLATRGGTRNKAVEVVESNLSGNYVQRGNKEASGTNLFT